MADQPFGVLDTVADYITDARTLLQDTVQPYRYDDPSLLVSFNTTLLEARRIRADLFVYLHGSERMPAFTANDDTPVDMEYPFRLAFVFGMVAHALMRDQEDITDDRARSFMSAFNSMLIGTGAAAISSPPGGGGGGPPPGR